MIVLTNPISFMTQVILPRMACCLANKLLTLGKGKDGFSCSSSGIVRCSARFCKNISSYIGLKTLDIVKLFQIPNGRLLGCLAYCNSNSLRRKEIFVEIEIYRAGSSLVTSNGDCRYIRIEGRDHRNFGAAYAEAERYLSTINFLGEKIFYYKLFLTI
jgi:hypothetical protein